MSDPVKRIDATLKYLSGAEAGDAAFKRSLKGKRKGSTIDSYYREAFEEAYVKAALWSTTDESNESGGKPMEDNYGWKDFAPSTKRAVKKDCADFVRKGKGDLETARDQYGMDAEKAGHNFWLTREGHGSGFWDEDMDEVGERLTELSEKFGEGGLYVGDDGKVYQMGRER